MYYPPAEELIARVERKYLRELVFEAVDKYLRTQGVPVRGYKKQTSRGFLWTSSVSWVQSDTVENVLFPNLEPQAQENYFDE